MIEAKVIKDEIFNFQIETANIINIEDNPSPWIIYKAKTNNELLGVVVYQGDFDDQPFPQAEGSCTSLYSS